MGVMKNRLAAYFAHSWWFSLIFFYKYSQISIKPLEYSGCGRPGLRMFSNSHDTLVLVEPWPGHRGPGENVVSGLSGIEVQNSSVTDSSLLADCAGPRHLKLTATAVLSAVSCSVGAPARTPSLSLSVDTNLFNCSVNKASRDTDFSLRLFLLLLSSVDSYFQRKYNYF